MCWLEQGGPLQRKKQSMQVTTAPATLDSGQASPQHCTGRNSKSLEIQPVPFWRQDLMLPRLALNSLYSLR